MVGLDVALEHLGGGVAGVFFVRDVLNPALGGGMDVFPPDVIVVGDSLGRIGYTFSSE